MDMLKVNPLKNLLSRVVSEIRGHNAILWAGSGLSLYAGYPSGKSMSEIILNSAKSDSDMSILKKHINSLMDISNEYSQLYSRKELMELIKLNFDMSPTTMPITHYLITKIPQIRTIITTNYDHLFEMVYGDEITACIGTDFKKTVKGKVDLFKIHSDTSNEDSIIITSKDYAHFYDNLDTILWGKIKGILAENSIIFVGYSLEDKNIQDVFEKIISQIDSSEKEFFIVTPTLHEHKLRHLNSICKTTHIPLNGNDFIEYIESEIRKNIILDAVAKKVSIDEAYRISREHGITPTFVSEPYGETTKPIVNRVELSPDTFFEHTLLPFGRGVNVVSSPETFEAFAKFINDCDCKELTIPAEDAVFYQSIKGIHVPENQKINGSTPEIVKLTKEETVEKLTLMPGDDIQLCCDVNVRGLWGNVKNRLIIEMACIYINILHEPHPKEISFGFAFPHTSNNALSDLSRLQLWYNGIDLNLCREDCTHAYTLKGLCDADKSDDFLAFIDDNINLYCEIQVIENELKDTLYIENELTEEDFRHIRMASSSISPTRVNYTGSIIINAGKMTLAQLDEYNNPNYTATLQMTYSEVLPDDCFQLLGKNIVLGTRKIKLIEPYIANYHDAKKMVETNNDVTLQFESKTGYAILEYVDIPNNLPQ